MREQLKSKQHTEVVKDILQEVEHRKEPPNESGVGDRGSGKDHLLIPDP